jgi:hypothetical protein
LLNFEVIPPIFRSFEWVGQGRCHLPLAQVWLGWSKSPPVYEKYRAKSYTTVGSWIKSGFLFKKNKVFIKHMRSRDFLSTISETFSKFNLNIALGYWNENMNQGFRFNNPKQCSNWIIFVSFYSSYRAIKNDEGCFL